MDCDQTSVKEATRSVLQRLGGAPVVAAELGLTVKGVRHWLEPDRGIPRSRHFDLLDIAAARGVSLSRDDLLSATKRNGG